MFREGQFGALEMVPESTFALSFEGRTVQRFLAASGKRTLT